MPNGEAAQAASTLTLPALPAPRFYAAAFAALERSEARSRMRQPRSATWIGSGSTLRQYSPLRVLPEAERRLLVARASSAVAAQSAPHWTITDCGERGAAAYRQSAASAPPAYSPLQAAILDAVRRMRRWQYYDVPPLPAPQSGAHPDCLCRVCLLASAAPGQRQSGQSAA